MSEFIGSRISLISKSDIRYVGTLHEINSENSTVALEQVTSFGTEGRKGNADEELAGSDSVYEYIVFRGSDVKDLRIEEPAPKENKPPQVPDDPAILGSGARPATQNGQQQHMPHQQPPPPQGFAPNQPPPFHQRPQMYYPQYSQFQNQRFAGPLGGPQPSFPGQPGFQGYPGMPYGPPPPGHFPPGQGFPHAPGPPFSPHQQMPFGGAGPQGPPPPPLPQQEVPPKPGQGATPTPAAEAALASESPHAIVPPVQASVPTNTSKPASKTGTPAPISQPMQAPTPPVESKPDVTSALAPPQSIPAETAKSIPTGPKGGKVVPAIPFAGPAAKRGTKPPPAAQPSAAAKPGQAAADAALQYQNATQAATAAVAAAMAKLPPAPGQKAKEGGAVDNLTQKVNDMRVDEKMRSSKQPASFNAGQRGSRGGRGRGGREQTRGLDVPTTDFDFESANAKFNKQDLVKEAIATGEPSSSGIESEPSVPVNGNAVDADGAADVVIPAATSGAPMYSKNSFFDNISSEAKDREEASSGRPGGPEFRSEERKRNMETFGMGSVDGGYRGGYRGRGRGRGYRGGGYRGGSRGGYRGGRGSQANSGGTAEV